MCADTYIYIYTLTVTCTCSCPSRLITVYKIQFLKQSLLLLLTIASSWWQWGWRWEWQWLGPRPWCKASCGFSFGIFLLSVAVAILSPRQWWSARYCSQFDPVWFPATAKHKDQLKVMQVTFPLPVYAWSGWCLNIHSLCNSLCQTDQFRINWI